MKFYAGRRLIRKKKKSSESALELFRKYCSTKSFRHLESKTNVRSWNYTMITHLWKKFNVHVS